MRIEAFLESFKFMGWGMLAIFAVVFVIIGLVSLLIRLFPNKNK